MLKNKLKVLWLSNILFPELSIILGKKPGYVGGWMQSSAFKLIELNADVNLHVISLYKTKDIQIHKGKDIKYILVPLGTRKEILLKFKVILDEFKPDIIHIHGSEYYHSLAMFDAARELKVILSVQGLVSVYEKYYFGGLKYFELLPSFRDIVRNDNLFFQKFNMKTRGKFEVKMIKGLSNVIGRTDWDLSHVKAINKSVNYFHCDEILRPEFYASNQWNIEHCQPQSIFISQSHYPIKGFHILLKALNIVKLHYPNFKVYVAGSNIVNLPFWRRNSYANLIKSLINEFDISDNIIFLGPLNGNEMVEYLVKSRIFINASAIENSPNSIGEAQILGTPVIASNVGGVSNMVNHFYTGLLYRFDDFEILAYYICLLFGNNKLCLEISERAKLEAAKRHDPIKNTIDLINIYKSLK